MSIKDKVCEHNQKRKNLDKKVLDEISKKAVSYKDVKQILLEKNLIDEGELLLILSKELKIPFLDLKKYKIPFKNQKLLSQKVAFKYKVLPVCKIGNALTLAAADPLDVIAYDDIRIITETEKIHIVLSREEDVTEGLNALYRITEDITKSFDESVSFDLEEMGEVKDSNEDLENLISESKHPPIVRGIDLIIYNSLKTRA